MTSLFVTDPKLVAEPDRVLKVIHSALLDAYCAGDMAAVRDWSAAEAEELSHRRRLEVVG